MELIDITKVSEIGKIKSRSEKAIGCMVDPSYILIVKKHSELIGS